LWKTAVPGVEGKVKRSIEQEVLDRPHSDVAAEASGRVNIEEVEIELTKLGPYSGVAFWLLARGWRQFEPRSDTSRGFCMARSSSRSCW
jgi:hypothetical protein